MTERKGKAARREELVDAAIKVLREHGVDGCTARSIADASSVSKSSLHYHFEDVDEVIDLAMNRLMADFADRIEAAAGAAPDPTSALWAAAMTYLGLGGRHSGRVALLWFEFEVRSVRRGRFDAIRLHTERGHLIWNRLMTATGVDDPREKAYTFYTALIGSIVEDTALPRPAQDRLSDIARAVGLAAPATAVLTGAP